MENIEIYALMRFGNPIQYSTDKAYLQMLADGLNHRYPSEGFYVHSLERSWIANDEDQRAYSK